MKRYIARKQTEIIALERAIAIQKQQLDEEMDEDVEDALRNRIVFNNTLLQTSKVERDNAMKQYKKRMVNSSFMRQSRQLRESRYYRLASIANSENAEETEGGRRRVRRRTTVRRIKKLRRTRRGSNRTYK